MQLSGPEIFSLMDLNYFQCISRTCREGRGPGEAAGVLGEAGGDLAAVPVCEGVGGVGGVRGDAQRHQRV